MGSPIMEPVHQKKSEMRLAYLHGIKDALNEHMMTTEAGMRALPEIKEKQVDAIVASVRKRHDKLVERIDRQIAKARSNA